MEATVFFSLAFIDIVSILGSISPKDKLSENGL